MHLRRQAHRWCTSVHVPGPESSFWARFRRLVLYQTAVSRAFPKLNPKTQGRKYLCVVLASAMNRRLHAASDEARRGSALLEVLLLLVMTTLGAALDIKGYSPSPSSLTARVNSTRGPRPTASQPTGPRPTISQPAGQRPTISQPVGPRPTISQPAGQRPTISQPAGPRPTISQPAGPRPIISQQAEQRPTTNRGNQSSGPRGSTPGVEELSVKPASKNRVNGWVIGGIIMCCVILFMSLVMYCLFRNKCRPRSSSGDAVELQSAGQRGQGSDDRPGRCTSNGVLNGSAVTSNIPNRDPTTLLTVAATLAEEPPTYVSLNYHPHEVARESRPPSAEDLHQSSDDAPGEVVVRDAGWRPPILRSISETSLPAYSEDMVISHPPA